jgi:hypothetical protein
MMQQGSTLSSWASLARSVFDVVSRMCAGISHVATPASRHPWPAVFIDYPQWTGDTRHASDVINCVRLLLAARTKSGSAGIIQVRQ